MLLKAAQHGGREREIRHMHMTGPGCLALFWVCFTVCSQYDLQKDINNMTNTSTTVNSKPITTALKYNIFLEASTKRHCAEQHAALCCFSLGSVGPQVVKFSVVSVQ